MTIFHLWFLLLQVIAKRGSDAKSQTDMRLGGYAAWGVLSSRHTLQGFLRLQLT